MVETDKIANLIIEEVGKLDENSISKLKAKKEEHVKLKKDIYKIHNEIREDNTLLKVFIMYNLQKIGIKKFEIPNPDCDNKNSYCYCKDEVFYGSVGNKNMIRRRYVRRSSSYSGNDKIHTRQGINSGELMRAFKKAGSIYEVIADTVELIGIEKFSNRTHHGIDSEYEYSSGTQNDFDEHCFLVRIFPSDNFSVYIQMKKYGICDFNFVSGKKGENEKFSIERDLALYNEEEFFNFIRNRFSIQDEEISKQIAKFEMLNNFMKEYILLNAIM